MRLTLDWDTPAERGEHYANVRARQTLTDGENVWQERNSSSGDGWHYIEWNAATSWAKIVELRDEFGDDNKRLRMDLIRHMRGSPFLQVLYTVKYMPRWGWQPEAGNQATRVGGALEKPEEEQYKIDGLIDYQKLARLLVSRVYGSQKGMAENFGWGASTVSGWVREQHQPNKAAKKKLRRAGRTHGLGHNVDDKSLDELDVPIKWYGEESERRRTIVEYFSVPWADSPADVEANISDDEESVERTLNVHTGTFNDNHSNEQLKAVHDDVEKHVRDVLSPDNTENNLPALSLDRTNQQAVSREEDSVNFESEVLDADEARYYRANMVSKTNAQTFTTADAEQHMLFEVVLWDETMTDIEWLVIGAWTGSTVSDATILKDTKGWF